MTQTRAGQPRHPLFGRAQKRSGPAQMTRHVVAHPYVYHRRWGETEVRVEARHALNLVERYVNALRQGGERLGWQVAVFTLDRPESFDHHACRYEGVTLLGLEALCQTGRSLEQARCECGRWLSRLRGRRKKVSMSLQSRGGPPEGPTVEECMGETRRRRLLVLLKSVFLAVALLAAHGGIFRAEATFASGRVIRTGTGSAGEHRGEEPCRHFVKRTRRPSGGGGVR